jgi:hypothetical protein
LIWLGWVGFRISAGTSDPPGRTNWVVLKLMNAIPRSLSSFATASAVALAVAVCAPGARADDTNHSNPASKIYVAETNGPSDLDTGDHVEDLKDHSVHLAEGIRIETREKSTNAVVLSNGTAMFVDPETRVEIPKFQQEPFNPNHNDPEVEPSISQTQGNIPHGTVGICTSKMVAGSTMVFITPQGSIQVKGRKAVIQCNGNDTTVSLIEGDVTVRGDQTTGGTTIKPGQQAIIHRTSPGGPVTITVQKIPDNQKDALNAKVAAACNARQQVFFQTVKSNNNLGASNGNPFTQPDPDQPQIDAIPVVTPTISPVVTTDGSSG